MNFLTHQLDHNGLRPVRKIPVLVLGIGLNGLGVARSIHSIADVHLVDENLRSCFASTRYGTKHLFKSIGGGEDSGLTFLAELHSFRKKFDTRPLIIPTKEKCVDAIISHYSKILTEFDICFDNPEVTKSLLSKQHFDKIARTGGFRVPETRIVSGRGDIAKMNMPCVLKPYARIEAYEASNAKAFRFESQKDLDKTYDQVSKYANKFVLQHWIEGGDDSIYFCIVFISANGELVSSFVGRKLVQWPLNVGGTASCTSAKEHHETLTTFTYNFFSHARYTGLAGIEYKLNSKDGLFYMIEPTVGRTDLQHEVCAVNGINVLQSMINYHAGLPAISQAYNTQSAVWTDSQSLENALANGGTAPRPKNARVLLALWRISDPGPWLHHTVLRGQQKITNILFNLRSRFVR